MSSRERRQTCSVARAHAPPNERQCKLTVASLGSPPTPATKLIAATVLRRLMQRRPTATRHHVDDALTVPVQHGTRSDPVAKLRLTAPEQPRATGPLCSQRPPAGRRTRGASVQPGMHGTCGRRDPRWCKRHDHRVQKQVLHLRTRKPRGAGARATLTIGRHLGGLTDARDEGLPTRGMRCLNERKSNVISSPRTNKIVTVKRDGSGAAASP